MITDWLDKIATRIAECEDPNTLDRIDEPTEAALIENRIVDGYYQPEDDDDAINKMPFFVLAVPQVAWIKTAHSSMFPHGTIEVAYFEHARNYIDEVPNTHVQHRLSHRYFVDFFEKLVYAIAGEPDTGNQIGITRIRQVQQAVRTPLNQRDSDEPNTDFWQMAFQFDIGRGE